MQSRGLVLLIFVEIAQGWETEGGGACLLPYSSLRAGGALWLPTLLLW